MTIFLKITPVTKPRMTQKDKWLTPARPCVARYWQYKDKVLQHNIVLSENYHIHFILPMPKTWSKKKKLEMKGMPHKQTPDKDNLEKGFLDALFKDDAGVWTGAVSKWWGDEGWILIKPIPIPQFPMEIGQ